MSEPRTRPRPARFHANVRVAQAGAGYDSSLVAILSAADFAAARSEISSWPSYRPTRLYELPGLAHSLGIAKLWWKDEGSRLGLGSFKALGGAYAVFRLLAEVVREQTGTTPSAADLSNGRYRAITQTIAVAAATDGNHGRAVAWGAREFGCRAFIYIHQAVSEGRAHTLASLGAELRRVPGNYDDSVRAVAADAAANGWRIVSDTAYPGYMEIPRTIMSGYGVMATEALAQLPAGARPTHLFMQAGCGGLAAAVEAVLWQRLGAARPHLIVVEPEMAACCYESALAGQPTAVTGSLETVMAGLACGEVSLLAWPILEHGALAFMTVGDDAAIAAMRALARGEADDPKIVAGEAGVGGLAGLLAISGETASSSAIGLGPDAQVLLFGSEGDTDPALYRALVGRTGEEVRAA